MSLVLSMNKSGVGSFGRARGRGKAVLTNCNVFNMRKAREKGLVARQADGCGAFRKAGFFLIATTVICGVVYLYQVNDLANKGYEIKEMENRIAHIKEANEKSKITEVELRSMYNIEKMIPNLDLVSA